MDLSQIINYGGFLIGMLGIVLSIYLYRLSIAAKDPCYYFLTYQNIMKLEGQGDTKIKLLYGDDEVDRVFTTYVWLWNNGKVPIQRRDIPEQAALRISLSDEYERFKILDYKVLKVSRKAIKFSILKERYDTLYLDFDFLDHNDGAAIEIQHTGTYLTQARADGIVLGAPKGIRNIRSKQGFSSDNSESGIPKRFTKSSYREKLYQFGWTILGYFLVLLPILFFPAVIVALIDIDLFVIQMNSFAFTPTILIWCSLVIVVVSSLYFIVLTIFFPQKKNLPFPYSLTFSTTPEHMA